MRIISGQYKGRHISVSRNFPSRPTTDFAKENLFNVLSNYFSFEGLSVLDLFAGTGSISYEFASRGSRVDLVEIDKKSIQFIRKNIETFKIRDINVYTTDVFKILPRLSSKYDIIFADPPYELKGINTLPDLVLGNDLLKKEGWFILEHSGNYSFSGHANFRDQRKYGSVHFSIFEVRS